MKFRIQRQIAHATLALSGVAAVGFCAPRAHAESDAASRALAVQLFDQGEALLAQQRTAEACPKYAESFHLDPQLGALIYLAECYEKNGQLASAWGSYREAEEMAQKRGDERATHAHERAGALQPRLDRLQIDVPRAARVPGLQVLRDGALVAETLWGNQAAIDAGKHHIEARASGYKPWQTDIEVSGEAKATNIAVPKLAVDATALASVGPKPGASQRLAAVAIGGASVVALGVGGFFGLSAQASYSDSKDLCNDSNICTSHGSDLRSTAKSKALVSTVATGVGVVGLAAAVVLWVTAPRAGGPERAALGGVSGDRRRWVVAPNRNAWGLEVAGAF